MHPVFSCNFGESGFCSTGMIVIDLIENKPFYDTEISVKIRCRLSSRDLKHEELSESFFNKIYSRTHAALDSDSESSAD